MHRDKEKLVDAYEDYIIRNIYGKQLYLQSERCESEC